MHDDHLSYSVLFLLSKLVLYKLSNMCILDVISNKETVMQNFHQPEIADNEDYDNVLRVIEDIGIEADCNNGDLKDQEENDRMEILEARNEDYLERQAERSYQ